MNCKRHEMKMDTFNHIVDEMRRDYECVVSKNNCPHKILTIYQVDEVCPEVYRCKICGEIISKSSIGYEKIVWENVTKLKNTGVLKIEKSY